MKFFMNNQALEKVRGEDSKGEWERSSFSSNHD
jgi:hypothetical protein